MLVLADTPARVMRTATRASLSGALALQLNVAFANCEAIWLYKCKNQHAIRNPSIKGEKQSAADETVDIFS